MWTIREPESKGFTLIELTVAAAVLAMIALAIVATFASGLRVYYRLRDFGGARADALISLEKMEREIRNLYDVTEVPFRGEAKKLSFCGAVGSGVGSICYYMDSGSKMLARREQGYPYAILKPLSDKGTVTKLAPIEKLEFSYYDYDYELKIYEWLDHWPKKEPEEEEDAELGLQKKIPTAEEKMLLRETRRKTKLVPLGVKVKMSYNDNGNIVEAARTAFIPMVLSAHTARLAEEAAKEKEKTEVGETE